MHPASTSEERPDYIPAVWRGGRLNRWLGQSPRRVFFWFLTAPPIAAVLAAYLFFVAKTGAIFALAGTVVLLWQAVVYAPRAWRAWRRESERGSQMPPLDH